MDESARRTTATSTGATDRVHDAWVVHHERLWRSVLGWSGDRDIASDAVAEAFAQAARRGAAIDDLGRWVWRAAFRIAAGLRRTAGVTTASRRRPGTRTDRPGRDPHRCSYHRAHRLIRGHADERRRGHGHHAPVGRRGSERRRGGVDRHRVPGVGRGRRRRWHRSGRWLALRPHDGRDPGHPAGPHRSPGRSRRRLDRHRAAGGQRRRGRPVRHHRAPAPRL